MVTGGLASARQVSWTSWRFRYQFPSKPSIVTSGSSARKKGRKEGKCGDVRQGFQSTTQSHNKSHLYWSVADGLEGFRTRVAKKTSQALKKQHKYTTNMFSMVLWEQSLISSSKKDHNWSLTWLALFIKQLLKKLFFLNTKNLTTTHTATHTHTLNQFRGPLWSFLVKQTLFCVSLRSKNHF